tara:strand:+ start:43 stop:849 length:807 start_codon:yes stop_codon:yes gene_type:complete
MGNSPKVSFITPCFNRPKELNSALSSCLSQTFEDWEVIVLDDHSDTADLRKIVNNFNDSRIRYFPQSKGLKGEAAAREAAIEKASSDVFITLDSDDLNYPNRAARCLEILRGLTPKLLYSRVMHFGKNNPSGTIKPALQPFNAKLLNMYNYITNPGTAFNRSAYNLAGSHYDCSLELATDYDQYLRMSLANVNIMAIDEVHVGYRKHPGAVTSGKHLELHRAIMQIREKHKISPFPLQAIGNYALPEIYQNIVNNPNQKALWTDDRWK